MIKSYHQAYLGIRIYENLHACLGIIYEQIRKLPGN